MMARLAALLLLLAVPARANSGLDLRNLSPLAELVVTGINSGTQPEPLTIRIDDRPGADYADRVNEERVMPPGPFTVRLRLAALQTPRQRPLNLATAFRATVFGAVAVAPLRIDGPPALPPGVHGWFFGPPGVVPLAGFDAVQANDPRFDGTRPVQVSRPGGDPVLAYGIRFTHFQASLPPGRWRLTFWTEDPGEWETLPPLLAQRIRVNGDDLLLVESDYDGWIATRYLAGRMREADPAQSPFAALGASRGRRIAGVVTVAADGVLSIELAGFPQSATHIAALTAEPADAPPLAAASVEAIRAARFAENWPVLAGPVAAAPVTALSAPTPEPAVTARGGIAVVRLAVSSPDTTDAAASIRWDGAPLPVRLLWGQWRWRRPGANVHGLVFSAAHLRADADRIPLRPDLPRPVVIAVHVPDGAAAGDHRGHLRLHTASGDLDVPFTVAVLSARRPDPAARVGAFLGFAPHLLGTPAWSKRAAWRDARAQAACDLATLRDLGLTAVTAPLAPLDDDPASIVGDLRAASAHFPGPVIAYEPLRAFSAHHQPRETADALAAVDAAVKAAGLPPVIWSIADEPAYAGTTEDVGIVARAIHAADPGALLAGHLNDPRDAVLLPDLALVTVNPGFGADAADIVALRARGIRPWLYNMPNPRLASGAYLWRSGADGMLQWHARMPTADPFDPTDGREGDVQFLWPTPGICAPADLDEDLLTLAEGEDDLRWLAWLDARSTSDRDAARLRRRLRQDIPATWSGAVRLPPQAPANWRAQIIALARKLNK